MASLHYVAWCASAEWRKQWRIWCRTDTCTAARPSARGGAASSFYYRYSLVHFLQTKNWEKSQTQLPTVLSTVTETNVILLWDYLRRHNALYCTLFRLTNWEKLFTPYTLHVNVINSRWTVCRTLLRLLDCEKLFAHTEHTCGRWFSCTCSTWIRRRSRFSKEL